jgi:hypothetical protein
MCNIVVDGWNTGLRQCMTGGWNIRFTGTLYGWNWHKNDTAGFPDVWG